jgi:hypothetical protein
MLQSVAPKNARHGREKSQDEDTEVFNAAVFDPVGIQLLAFKIQRQGRFEKSG